MLFCFKYLVYVTSYHAFYSQLCCFTRPKGLTLAAGSLPAALLPYSTLRVS